MGSFSFNRNEQNSHHHDGGEYSVLQRITDSEKKNHIFFKFPEPVTKKLVNKKYFWYDISLTPIVGITLVHYDEKIFINNFFMALKSNIYHFRVKNPKWRPKSKTVDECFCTI